MKILNFKLKIWEYLPFILFLVLYLLIISFKLITHPTPFYDWDEAINVQVSKETVENKSLVPLWQGQPWLDKPPLPFLIFGSILKLTPFIQPEISLRITSLILSIVSLILIYGIYLKALHGTAAVEEERSDGKTAAVNKVLALLTVIITAFTPIFLQRSQIVNLDVFLLIGWLGYLLFVQNFWLSLFFLAVGVLTKSLLGFYPVIVLIAYNVFMFLTSLSSRAKSRDLFKKSILKLSSHLAILTIWYLVMLLIFKEQFWQQHIVETHVRRVTASIESHFGQRTYYIDLMIEQLKWFFGLSVFGFSVIMWRFLRRKLTTDKLMYGLFLMPWFIFLNLTKTKIFWYLYPAIPQFAYLTSYPITLFRNKKILLYLVSCILVFFVFYQNFIKTNFFTTYYSKPEDYYHLALYAKNRCDSLTVLAGKETREATKTLEDLGLTITSTKHWGDHPSIVYYFSKKVDFVYEDSDLNIKKNSCLALRNDDFGLINQNMNLRKLKNFNSYFLFKR